MPGKKGSIGGGILFLSMIILVFAALMLLYQYVPGFNLGSITFSTTTINQAGTTTITQANGTTPNFTSYDYYVLSLINKDRNQYGLGNVTLSSTSSGQQHTQSMLNYHYFSHWDIYGLKPYMRYTLLGGLGAVSENIAFNTSSYCIGSFCSGRADVEKALKAMEYSMMYNDSICCNNGHRDNILDPRHNKVSIGISYNSSLSS